MKAPANKPKSDPFPQGTYSAVCYGVIDLGTQEKQSKQYGMQEKRQIRLQWEVPALRVKYTKDDKELEGPKVTGKTYTFSTYQKSALAQHLTAWGFTDLDNLDFKTLIGKMCMLNVAHIQVESGETISYISSVMQSLAGTPELTPENQSLYYSIDENGKDIPPEIYDWMQKAIKVSPEYEDAGKPAPSPQQPDPTEVQQGLDDDIPF